MQPLPSHPLQLSTKAENGLQTKSIHPECFLKGHINLFTIHRILKLISGRSIMTPQINILIKLNYLCTITKTLKGRKQTKMEGGQSGTYLRLTRASSGLRVSVAKTKQLKKIIAETLLLNMRQELQRAELQLHPSANKICGRSVVQCQAGYLYLIKNVWKYLCHRWVQ